MPEKLLNKRNYIIAHTGFWLFSITFLSIIFYLNSEIFSVSLIGKAAISNIGFAASVYINLYLLIPRFLKQKNYIFYIFWLMEFHHFCGILFLFSPKFGYAVRQ